MRIQARALFIFPAVCATAIALSAVTAHADSPRELQPEKVATNVINHTGRQLTVIPGQTGTLAGGWWGKSPETVIADGAESQSTAYGWLFDTANIGYSIDGTYKAVMSTVSVAPLDSSPNCQIEDSVGPVQNSPYTCTGAETQKAGDTEMTYTITAR